MITYSLHANINVDVAGRRAGQQYDSVFHTHQGANRHIMLADFDIPFVTVLVQHSQQGAAECLAPQL